MNAVIIIRGPLGVGKTTVAERLAEKLSAEYVSVDAMLSENKLDGGKSIPVENFITVNTLMMPTIRAAILKDKSVIIDGNFYYKEQIEHLENNLSVPIVVFTLMAPIEVCLERDKKRKEPYGEDATRVVYNLVSRVQYGIVIHTEHQSVDETVEETISRLSKF